MNNEQDAHDIEIDLVLLGARHKMLLILKSPGGYSAVLLNEDEYHNFLEGRKRFEAKNITQVTRLARMAVEEGGV